MAKKWYAGKCKMDDETFEHHMRCWKWTEKRMNESGYYRERQLKQINTKTGYIMVVVPEPLPPKRGNNESGEK